MSTTPTPVPARRRRRWLLALLVVVLLLGDACQRPERQVAMWAGVGLIRTYQYLARPLVRRVVVCRYSPSCSEYGRLALHQYGFWPGCAKTAARLWRCRGDVPVGTRDDP